jgi:hypothetical protein
MYIGDFLLIIQNNPSEDNPTIKQQLSSRRVKTVTLYNYANSGENKMMVMYDLGRKWPW